MAKKSKAKQKLGKQRVSALKFPAIENKQQAVSQEARTQMSFEVSADFRQAYKLYALQQGMTMLEVFQESFELFQKVYPSKRKEG